jgi:hypothetical protein
MQFESRIKRKLIFQIVLGSLPDIAFAVFVVWWFKGDFWLFLMAFFGLQLVYLLAWVVRSTFTWIHFYLFGRKEASRYLCDYLHQNKYPAPRDYEDSVEAYLGAVVDNNSLDISTRLKAAFELGTFHGWNAQSQLQHSLRMKLAFEDAIDEYKRAFVRGTAPS